jgi:hypothetical protein
VKLDDRLRSAATSLRSAVDAQVGQDVPELSPRQTTHRRRIMIAIGVAVVVVAGSLAAVLQADGSDPTVRVVEAPAGAADHFRIGAVPDGMVLQLAADGSSTISGGTADWTVEQHYIRYNAARDHADGILTIHSGPGDPNADLTTTAGRLADSLGYPIEPIEIRGHPGIRIGPAIAWQESPGVVVAINGPLSEEELLKVADGLRQRPAANGFDLQYLPANYEALAEQPGYSKQTADSIVWYATRGGAPKTLKLFVTKDTAVPLLADLAQRDARLVEVRGHEAVITEGMGLGQKVSWDERSGLRLQLTGTGLTTKQLLEAASSMVPLTDGQWARYGEPHSVLFPKPGMHLPATDSPTAPVASTSPPTSADALGLTVRVPSGWTLRKSECPSAQTVTVVAKQTAKPLPAGCEHVSGPWASIQRLPKDLTGIDDACGPGLSDDMPFCQAIENDPGDKQPSLGIERRFYAGLDVLVSLHHAADAPGAGPEFAYASPTLIQQAASGSYPTPQALIVAQHALQVVLSSGCASLADASPTRAVRQCDTLDFPTGGAVREVGAASLGGSVPSEYFIATVVGESGSARYRLLVHNHWDTTKRWVTQSVTSITRAPDTQQDPASMCTTPPIDPRFVQHRPLVCP